MVCSSRGGYQKNWCAAAEEDIKQQDREECNPWERPPAPHQSPLTILLFRRLHHPSSILSASFIPYSISGIDINLISLLIAGFGKLINEVLDILWWVVIIGAIGSWFMGFNSHPIFNLIDDICQPFYNIIRRILPPMSGLDFSPIILLVLITLTELILVPPIYHFASLF